MEEIRDYWGRLVKLVSEDAKLFGEIDKRLPKPSEIFRPACRPVQVDTVLELSRVGDHCLLFRNGRRVTYATSLLTALESLENVFQLDLASFAPGAAFVHSGVVAVDGKALLLPGTSFCGKSTLVNALLRKGATYYSDEFAIIDADGYIYPYRRPLTLRRGQATVRIQPKVSVEVVRCRLGVVLDCRYLRGSRWRPYPLSQGEGILRLFANTVSAKLTPARDLDYLAQASAGARFYRSDRGDANAVAERVLGLLK